MFAHSRVANESAVHCQVQIDVLEVMSYPDFLKSVKCGSEKV